MKRLLLSLSAVLLTSCIPAAQEQINPGTASGAQRPSSSGPAGEQDAPSSITAAPVVTIDERVLPSGAVEIGRADAPASLMLFTNASCTYCEEFHQQLLPRVISEYVNAGKVRVSIVPFVLRRYSDSEGAAATFICAAQQKKGMPTLDVLFRDGMDSAGYRAAMTNLAFDEAALNGCRESDQTRSMISGLQSVAASLDVSLVPAYFVNGTKFIGLPEYADLKGQIEEAISK